MSDDLTYTGYTTQEMYNTIMGRAGRSAGRRGMNLWQELMADTFSSLLEGLEEKEWDD